VVAQLYSIVAQFWLHSFGCTVVVAQLYSCVSGSYSAQLQLCKVVS
jgi:hypothetical protein